MTPADRDAATARAQTKIWTIIRELESEIGYEVGEVHVLRDVSHNYRGDRHSILIGTKIKVSTHERK